MKKRNIQWARTNARTVNKHIDAALKKLEELKKYAEELNDYANANLLDSVIQQVEGARTEFEEWTVPIADDE